MKLGKVLFRLWQDIAGGLWGRSWKPLGGMRRLRNAILDLGGPFLERFTAILRPVWGYGQPSRQPLVPSCGQDAIKEHIHSGKSALRALTSHKVGGPMFCSSVPKMNASLDGRCRKTRKVQKNVAFAHVGACFPKQVTYFDPGCARVVTFFDPRVRCGKTLHVRTCARVFQNIQRRFPSR